MTNEHTTNGAAVPTPESRSAVESVEAAVPEESAKPSFGREIDLFVKHVDALGDALLAMVFAVQSIREKFGAKLKQYEEEHCEVVDRNGQKALRIPNTHFREWKRKNHEYEQFSLAQRLLPRSLLVSMISQYDAYLGRILRAVFIGKPEMLNASDKKISFESLSQFSTIEAAREFILEKEVEAILRSSHIDQFRWMERNFNLELTKGLASWPSFIEVTERRNLFVHTDGIVSSQYLSVCKLNKCKIDQDLKEGQRLGVPQDYLEAAHSCIFEIGVKLGHVLWRKLFPEEREDADSNLSRLTYDLIDTGRYPLAITLLDFATSELKKFSSEARQLTLIVNRAQAYKWSGDDDRCKKIMRAVDWSAKGDEFRLADAVLAEDWSRAERLMKRIGKDGPVSKLDYRDWPLFRNWRKEEAFLNCYRNVFGEDFASKSEVKTVTPSDDSDTPTLGIAAATPVDGSAGG